MTSAGHLREERGPKANNEDRRGKREERRKKREEGREKRGEDPREAVRGTREER